MNIPDHSLSSEEADHTPHETKDMPSEDDLFRFAAWLLPKDEWLKLGEQILENPEAIKRVARMRREIKQGDERFLQWIIAGCPIPPAGATPNDR